MNDVFLIGSSSDSLNFTLISLQMKSLRSYAKLQNCCFLLQLFLPSIKCLPQKTFLVFNYIKPPVFQNFVTVAKASITHDILKDDYKIKIKFTSLLFNLFLSIQLSSLCNVGYYNVFARTFQISSDEK